MYTLSHKKQFYIRRSDNWKNNFKKNELINNIKLNISEYDNAIIMPPKGKNGGVGILKDSSSYPNIVAGFIRDIKTPPHFGGFYGTYEVDLKKIKFIDKSVIFGGVLVGHFGHFILESMCRLWYILKNPKDNRTIVFIVSLGKKKWFNDFFHLLGIEQERILIIEEVTQFSHITIPDESIHAWSFCHGSNYVVPYEIIVSNLPKINFVYKKIYLSRSKVKDSQLITIGEEFFENFYEKQGFKIIYPETLPVNEQINLIAHADEVVCSMGTLAHFMMFAKKSTRFHLLLRSPYEILPSIIMQIKVKEINFILIDVSQNLFLGHRMKGVVLAGSTPDFCDYVQDYYGIQMNSQISPYLEEYCRKWIDKFTNIENYKAVEIHKILNWTSVDWLNQLHEGFYGEELSPDTKKVLSAKLPKKFLGNDKADNFKLELSKKQNSAIPLVLDLHVGRVGWVDGLFAHEMTNNATNNQIEALRIHSLGKLNFEYCTEYAGNWGERVKAGEISGTIGKSTPITGFALYLDEKTAKQYEIFYRLADKNGKWSDWTHDGQKVSIGSAVIDIAFKIVRK